MKNHFITLIDTAHRRLTIILLISSALLIIGSNITGIVDNLPGILMLFAGVILLFFSFIHPWREIKNYAILAVVSIGIIFLIFLAIFILSALHMQKYINEGVVMVPILFFCIPGIVVSIIGILICAGMKK
jgi:hypothetical protein